MTRHWLGVSVGLLVAGAGHSQPPVATPPPQGAAAPPSLVTPLIPPKPTEWPREVGGKPVGYYIERLSSTDPTVREYAAKVLPLFGPSSARAGSRQLVVLMGDTDPGVRVNAILALANIGFDSKDDLHKGVAALRAAIQGTQNGSIIRLYAVRCLGLIGPEAYTALDALLMLTKDPSWETRDAAAMALGRVAGTVWDRGTPATVKRPVSPQARARLFDLLKDASQAVRLEAIQSLLFLGSPTTTDPVQYAKEVTPLADEVSKRLAAGTDKAPGEKDPQVRLWLHTLHLMYDDRQVATAVKEMTAAVTSTDPAMRMQGLTALTMCGPLAAKALDEVRAALWAAEVDVVKAAIMCLLYMGPDARKAVGDLQRLADSATDKELKAMAAEAARRLSPGAVPAK